MPSQPLTPEDEEQRRHGLSEMLKGKDIPALLKWVYGHGQLKGEFPEQAIGKEAVLKFAEKAIKQRDQQKELECLRKLEAQSDCIEDSCGLDAELLRHNLLNRIMELESALSNPQKGK